MWVLNLLGLFQIPPFSFRCCRFIEMNWEAEKLANQKRLASGRSFAHNIKKSHSFRWLANQLNRIDHVMKKTERTCRTKLTNLQRRLLNWTETKLKIEENGENERICHKRNRQINTILNLQNLTSEDFKENTSNCRLSKECEKRRKRLWKFSSKYWGQFLIAVKTQKYFVKTTKVKTMK